jgi:two-component system cell cycle response regulator
VKILVADDDAVSRSVMRRMLVQSGYDVTLASDGEEAVHLLTQEDGPRLVLLDWMMPGLDGPAVCRAVRTSTRLAYIYITLLTSRESKEDLVAGLEAGADDYLTTPCNTGELKARLRTGERILHLEDNLVQAREDMRFKATHDALTHLLDRGAILNDFGLVVDSALVTPRDFSTILCDVDLC